MSKVTITSTTTIHSPGRFHLEPLSLADSGATIWPVTPITLLYPLIELDKALLTRALQHVLAVYPILGAKLHLTPPPNGPAHARRYGRVWAQWGDGAGAPGAKIAFARWDGPLADVLPTPLSSPTEETGKLYVSANGQSPNGTANNQSPIGTANGHSLNGSSTKYPAAALDTAAGATNELCDATQIVVLRPHAHAHAGPAFAAQITTFTDGIAVGVRGHHVLMDAHSMVGIIRSWFETYDALLLGNAPLPALEGTFDAAPLAAAARGNIDAAFPDPALLAEADKLPGLRIDMTRSNPGVAVPFADIHVAPGADKVEGHAPNYAQWNWMRTRNVGQFVLQFSKTQVERIYQLANPSPSPDPTLKKKGQSVSRLDAIFAFAWSLLIRARALDPSNSVSLGQCIGLRGRTVPPLPEEHYGANLFMTASQLPASVVRDATSLPAIAKAIRASIAAYTPAAVGAELHRMAFASDPARRWNMFFGTHDTHTTSWLRLGVYGLKLGGEAPVWVQPAFPSLEGFLFAIEAKEGGVNLHICTEREVFDKLVADPALVGL